MQDLSQFTKTDISLTPLGFHMVSATILLIFLWI